MGISKVPLIANMGVGVDSMAMAIGLRDHGETPDLFIHANTGNEKHETVAYREVTRNWLYCNDLPDLVIVARPPGGRNGTYSTLEENCLINETLPSLAFGFKSCSLKWKAEAMDRWILGVKRGKNKCPGWRPALDALAAGIKPVKCIGYDNGPKDSRRAVKRDEDEHFKYRYPLREWGWDRDKCMDVIAAEGLPIPLKSACWFCPASQTWEVLWLMAKHPDLFLRSVAMEDGARDGKNGLDKVRGLWGRDTKNRPGSWREWAEQEGYLKGNEIVADRDELLRLAAEMKPDREANDCGC